MDREVTDWLLEGPEWLKYAVELQLLDLKPDVQPVLKDTAITKVIQRLKDKQAGIPALRTGKVLYTETGKAYWDLFFLADIGLTAREAGLEAEADEIFGLQSPDGTFNIPPNVRPNYFCMSAILMSSLARMGYQEDPRLGKYIHAILNSQGCFGGWDCFDGDSELVDTGSCPMDNMNILMLLGQYDKYRKNPRFNGAIDLLLDHWERRSMKYQLYGFGVGKRFASLQYPAVKYGILRVLDVLSLFPYAVEKLGFQSMLDFVHQKASDGKYSAGLTDGSCYTDFDFNKTGEPSRWLTFLVKRIEKRISQY